MMTEQGRDSGGKIRRWAEKMRRGSCSGSERERRGEGGRERGREGQRSFELRRGKGCGEERQSSSTRFKVGLGRGRCKLWQYRTWHSKRVGSTGHGIAS
eukprot:3489255-Rhodomonas_salina.1